MDYKGPWKVNGDAMGPKLYGGFYEVVDATGRRIADVGLEPETGVTGTLKIARLIAESPRLLEAAKRLITASAAGTITEAKEGDQTFEDVAAALRDLSLVVMKAEGQSLAQMLENASAGGPR